MSHNYPYRRPQPDSSLRSDPGQYSSSDRRRVSPDHDSYRAPQESSSTSYPSSSSSRVTKWTQDGAVRILDSCGLDSSDLALLAQMPEDSLTVESLPQVLNQIKGRRGMVKQYPPPPSPSSSSYAPSSTRRPHVSPPTSDWDRPHSQPLQYQADPVKPSPAPDFDRWGNPITFSSVRAQQTSTALPPSTSSSSSSSSSYTVDLQHRRAPPDYGKTSRDAKPVSFQDYNHKSATPELLKPGRDTRQFSSQDYHHRSLGSNTSLPSSQSYNHRPGSLDFGKTGRDSGPAFSQDRPSFSSASRDRTTHPSRHSQPGPADYKPPPLLPDSRPKPLWGGSSGPETSFSKTTSSSSSQPGPSMPSKENAMDFHGRTPPAYPYSCSLCAITVMSEKVWLKHINGPHHADGQLNLLQRFPNWDCRLETVGRADNQSKREKDDKKPTEKPQAANQSSSSSQKKPKPPHKATEKSKVVCVKFPAHSVDESYLKKLAEPFGRIVKILMFPSLAFVELGSMDQARDMVKFHENYPLTMKGEQMEFRLSNTFNFLQSSCVVTFSPPPSGEDGQSDLISIIKRFGPPLYTLFLPSKAFVEMKDASEAQKLVDYYSSNHLRINQDRIQVSFAQEYNSLMRIPSARKYEEEEWMKSSSKEKESRRSRERDEGRDRSREKSDRERRTRTRSKSRDRSSTDGRRRSESREGSSRERRSESREGSSSQRRSESREGSSRERRSESREGSSRERRSESREGSSRERRPESRKTSVKEEETEMPVLTAAYSGPDPDPVTELKPEAPETQQTDQEEPSEDDSDIEGMEVIGEDGEDLQDEEMEVLDGGDEEEEEEEPAEKGEGPPERTDSPEADKNVETKEGEEEEEVKKDNDDERQQEEKEEEEGSEPTRETETQQEEDESEPDFPVDLDSCITLDELVDDDWDHEGEDVGADHQSSSSRVLYFNNVPLGSFTDSEFLRLVKGYGKAVRFFRIPGREGGFIEMSSSSEAQEFIEGLNGKPVRVNGCNIYVQISKNYHRLTNGWTVEDLNLDEEEEEEEKNESSRGKGSRRSQRLSKKPSDKDETSRKQSSKKTPEGDRTSRSEEKESRTPKRKASAKQPTSRQSAGKSSEKKSPEEDSTTRTTRGSKRKSTAQDLAPMRSAEDKRKEVESTPETDENRSDKKFSPEEDEAGKKVPEQDLEVQDKSTSKASEEESSRPAEESSEKASQEKKSRMSQASESTNNKTEENKTQQNKSKTEELEPKSNYDSKIEENGSDKSSKKTPETESKQEKPSDLKQTPGKDSVQEQSRTKAIKRKGTQKNGSVPEKKEKNECRGEAAEVPQEEPSQVKDSPESALKDPGSPHPLDSPGEQDQKPADQLIDSNVPMKEQSEPAGGATELQKPTKPVGTEFVRPVVGYFCNLCQLIYADEDEAKQKHCSSLEHYRKYQEKTGKDPWAS